MEIYAEINKKTLAKIEANNFRFPNNVVLKRKKGSRACFLDYEDKPTEDILIDFLDNNGICWQKN